MNVLNRILSPYRGICDSVVLGCTHYSLIRDEIQGVLPDAFLLDGCVGISRKVKRQLESYSLLNDREEKGTLKIINTKNEDLIKRSYEILEK